MTPRALIATFAAAPLALALFACSSSPSPVPGAGSAAAPGAAPKPAAAAPAAAKPAATASAAASGSASARVEFREESFVENDQNRDPFRSFAKSFVPKSVGARGAGVGVQAILSKFSIEDLRLVALVTHTDEPRAMLLDPHGRGWVAVKGQFIGRPEIVHAGGQTGADYEVYWKIDRIRDADIVLVREDPQHPGVAAQTHVIPLRPEGEAQPLDTGM